MTGNVYNSYCRITLKNSYTESLPKSLRMLNISGNPCAKNASFVDKLQGCLPSLEIIRHDDTSIPPSSPTTDSAMEGPGDGEDKERGGSDRAEERISLAAVHQTVLSSEEILREVVDRKCRLQSYSQFNIESAIKVGAVT